MTGKAEPPALAEARPAEELSRSKAPAATGTPAVTRPPRPSAQTPTDPAAGSQTPVRSPARPFALQVGAFSTETNAGKLRSAFAAQGYSVEIIKRARDGRTLYLVWVGRYGTEEEARTHIAEIRKQQSVTPIVVTR